MSSSEDAMTRPRKETTGGTVAGLAEVDALSCTESTPEVAAPVDGSGSIDTSAILQAIGQLREDMKKDMNEATGQLREDINDIKRSVSGLVENALRNEARTLFGESFAKSFLVRSLNDAVHLLTKANYKDLKPSSSEGRNQAAEKLAKKAQLFVVPFAEAFLTSFDVHYSGGLKDPGKMMQEVKDAYKEQHYKTGLRKLIGLAKSSDKIPKDIVFFIETLKFAFDDSENISVDLLLCCDGPGVMIMALLSQMKYEYLQAEKIDVLKFIQESQGEDATSPEKETNIFKFLQEQIEFDMRGQIQLINDHATIMCGEGKSSRSGLKEARSRLELRLRFLKLCVETVFPAQFKKYVLVGHIFVSKHTGRRKSHHLDEGKRNNVTLYFHEVA